MLRFFFSVALFISQFLAAGSPIIIGIAGGTGSGKTTIAKKLQTALGSRAVLIEQDCYYKDLSHLSMAERNETNFDHPQSIDFDKLYQDIFALKNGQQIDKPIYSFKTHTRVYGANRVEPADVIIVEGILIFTDKKTRELCDLKIYVETDDDVRVLRRIERDIEERGRDFASVKHQYLTTVKPMHVQHVETSKQYADAIIPGNADTSAVVSLIISGLRNPMEP